MKKILSLILIGLFVSVALLNGVSATTTDEETIVRNHGPFYFSSKPLHYYEEPGFVIGYYNRIEYSMPGIIRHLYSPHLLFGWDITICNPPYPFKYSFAIGLFASRVLFNSFESTFTGFFSGTESGFICGYVDNVCTFYYGFYPEAMN